MDEEDALIEKQLQEELAGVADIEAKEAAAAAELAKLKAQMAQSLVEEAAVHGVSGACVAPPGYVTIQHAEAVLAEQLALREAALTQAIAAAEDAPDEPDDETASAADSALGSATEEVSKKRARKLRVIGAKATIAHVRSHTFAKPRWGSCG